ncbi:MAG: hypothetical protein QMD85_01575 [Candidatus Aenigmarchaeota archaeon]|nr:hypothetical protein [Candidatus Aenigmarchaeota archaeon]MDI6722229.1 hypothetical protein [Candidatus Aenigmarchaeota archaeon]
MIGRVARKVAGGKLVKATADFNGNTINSVKITGDFFLHPEESIEYIENMFAGADTSELDEIKSEIDDFISRNGIQLIGFSSQDIIDTIKDTVLPYKGVIIEESLKDNSSLKEVETILTKTSRDGEWHLVTVKAWKKEIDLLEKNIKDRWYAHFWRGDEMIVIFENKKFIFSKNDDAARNDAVNYGIGIGIPREELTFPTGD